MIAVSPLAAPCGAEATGVDLATDLRPATVRTLLDALYAHRFLVIRDQRLTKDRYVAFGEQVGRPHAHALDHIRMSGYPTLQTIGNTEPRHRDDTVRHGQSYWHTDQSYEAEPATATTLYSVKAPREGGETLIADQVAAYEALPADMKRRIDGLEARHIYGGASGQDGEAEADPIATREQMLRLPPVFHPLVRTHPVTGRKALYAVAGTPIGIKSMADTDALALLKDLKRHALDPRFVTTYRWRVGDLGIWDTLATLHSGTRIEYADSPDHPNARLLWRISCKGLPPPAAARIA